MLSVSNFRKVFTLSFFIPGNENGKQPANRRLFFEREWLPCVAYHNPPFAMSSQDRETPVEDTESQDYEVLGPNTPTHVPTDPRHRADILDIVYVS
ncbi:hypothetical protein EVAR_93128_1 [Eumeta japonica]|uniref:Uncharacterized protein n=1 Tax=Eumeta variegata TaxID=151549 RepID=A0A4C1TIF1_EUMVA|nr:hypothetical protein EVAR_93128_1 [Eumeta japonica]